MTTTTAYAPSTSAPEAETATYPSIFEKLPPIFVLPTRLSLDELHTFEDSLTKRGALLTYDVSEAKIVLGIIGQSKRAALELRARGVWTEEVSAAAADQPSAKWRRLNSDADEHASGAPVIDLSTESEDEGPDGHGSQRKGPKTHLRKPSRTIEGSHADSERRSMWSEDHYDAIVSDQHIKVVKLDWLIRSSKEEKMLPLEPYVVYHARVVKRPEGGKGKQAERKPLAIVDHDTSHILERAMGDAASQPPPPSSYASKFSARRMKHPPDAQSSKTHHPPTLYRQTTSEHDEAVPIPPAPDWVKENLLYACMRSAPLHPPNERFIDQLVKIRKVRELTLDEIGVRAYSTSIASIAAYPYEFRSPVEVLSLPGCDTKIANLFVEFKNSLSGTLEAAEALEKDPTLAVLHRFYNIWGVGAKTAREFCYQRQWRDLDDVIEHGWNSLSRVQQIGLKYYDEFLAGIHRSEVAGIAQTIHRHANLVRPGCEYDGRGIECVVVGGYRRGKEVCGDVDLVLSHRDDGVTKNLVVDIVSSLEKEGWVTHTLSLHMTTSNRQQQTLPYRGEAGAAYHFDTLDKALVVWQDPNFDDKDDQPTEEIGAQQDQQQLRRRRNPNPHRRVDIIISPWRTVGCAILGWSGDTTFERDLRRYAKKAHGWKFDSSGVRERTTGGKVIDLEGKGTTWEERERLVMEGLGVEWRPAMERCTR
jgi:DNA polymerase IV